METNIQLLEKKTKHPNWFKQQLIELKKNNSNSKLFWSGLLYLTYIIILCINFELAMIISGFGSLLMIASMMDDWDGKDNHLWFPLTWLFYVFLIGFAIGYVIKLIYDKTIDKFNIWLNNKNKDE